MAARLVATEEGEMWIMVGPDDEDLFCPRGGWVGLQLCLGCWLYGGRVGVFGQGVAYRCGWLRAPEVG